ncbi:hypothetical protein HCX49_12095 [Sphingobacterium kitahiroshimense]|uniref:hypothetical protein n=1 Tax=Sphingobacterium sp. B16(2022) TaxID=2914044 RepID=UPI00143C415B|nr:hypothetical protein [Sphingobacterium sp. B16(2022)]NJI73945.1 hypothetical protein [Sphingobacterium sp. B16(2022)]
MRNKLKILWTLCFIFMLNNLSQGVELKTKQTQITLDGKGYYSSIKVAGKELLGKGSYPILSAVKAQQIILPKELKIKGDQYLLSMEDGQQIELKVKQLAQAITYEIIKISDVYNMVVFGPVKINSHEVVGEIVGIAQDVDVAFGMQSLNAKTNGGIPQESASLYSSKFTYTGANTELSVASVPFYNLVAVDAKDGTVFQLSARNRQKIEYRKVQQLEKSLTLPVSGPDGSIIGAKIALFGDHRDAILNRIGHVELEQGLPHPMLDGEWDKISRSAMDSYLISNFSEEDFDFVLDKVKMAGFRNVYHTDPFETWGHFKWKSSFVKDGDQGVKVLVDKAKAKGIRIGVHTLTNFLTTNDAYVTPIPSKHLLKQGELKLLHNLNADQQEIEIQVSGLFEMPLSLNAMQIDDELITFGKVEKMNNRMRLTDCKRGAFGTKATAHDQVQPLYKLWDYPYKTLFPDLVLQDEFAQRLATIFNTTGLKQISFDGLEGSMYTGHDYYATARFITEYYKNLKDKTDLINDASRLDHFLWHTHTRMNWGEPWGEEMRKGQVENRIKNQEYFRRNLFPRMLGWFLVRLADRKFETTTLEDLEWALSESAGFDSGYAMSINMQTLRKHGQIDQLLEAMKNWDVLRKAKAFNDDQMKRLRDPETEWHLKKVTEDQFLLYPLYISDRYRCDLSEMQPGQPGGADWSWHAPNEGTYALRLKVEGGGTISNPSFTTSKGVIKIEGAIETDQYLLLDHDGNALLTDKNFNTIKKLPVQGKAILPQGNSSIAFACDVQDDTPTEVLVRYSVRGEAEKITKRK